ncbi:vitamin K epoxide reductase family protein [Kineosporia sp. R_H_3]|uniref:vitamin K epoxide reductase family protein n=1 Tax=Kineosporia sp. R_H_3 TaxID=1961848 RepID=UPI000B4B6861|nr:vitamin K epoxide reductase family protein [Kineosporia sp. R_H_3]
MAEQAPAGAPARSQRATAWTLTWAGLVGLAAAFVLLVEKVAVLANAAYVPSCSINPVLSCGSVMNTPQADAFGFPNPSLGVAGFAALLTIGVVLLTGARLPGWFWWGIQAGTTLGVLFVHWLIFQSLYRIGALCPYCMAVWVAAIAAFVATTAHNVCSARLPVPARLRPAVAYAPSVVTAWLVAIAALATVRFWDYWSTLAA